MPRRNAEGLARSRTLRQLWNAMGQPPAHAVGGFVRDHLLARSSKDVDLVLDGSADEVAHTARRLAEHLGGPVHLLGRPPRSVWRIHGRRLTVELWPLGRLSLVEDVLRRDFTCNALLWRLPDGPLVDLVDGIGDLDRHQLRAVRRDNLVRDPVRLLRAPRFLAQLDGFVLETRTRRWIAELAPRLSSAPRERLGQELLAMLRAPHADRGVQAVLDLGLLVPVAPPDCLPDPQWISRAPAAAQMLNSRHPLRAALAQAGDAARLALLTSLWAVYSNRRLAPYAWSRDVLRNATIAGAMAGRARAAVEGSPAQRRELIHDAGAATPALIALGAAAAACDGQTLLPWRRLWRLWRDRGPQLCRPEPLLSPHEIAHLAGVQPGPELGKLISALTRAQVRGEIRSAGSARSWVRNHP